jgi:hypothetical protein
MWLNATSALTITDADGVEHRVETSGAVSISYVNEMP